MADPIEHDAASTTATVATKALKWGALGAIAAFAVPAVLIGGAGLLAGAGIAAMATGGFFGALASLAGFAVGAAGVIGGLVAGTSAAATYGTTAAAGGALVGVIKGGNQVTRENAAARERIRGHDFSSARRQSDLEIKGIQTGYRIAAADMEPMIQQREQAAFEKGQEFVVNKIQEHMNSQMAAQTDTKKAGFAGKELSLKCESKAEAVLKQREVEAMTQKQV